MKTIALLAVLFSSLTVTKVVHVDRIEFTTLYEIQVIGIRWKPEYRVVTLSQYWTARNLDSDGEFKVVHYFDLEKGQLIRIDGEYELRCSKLLVCSKVFRERSKLMNVRQID